MTQLTASLIVLGFIGLIDAIYLSWHYFKKQPLVCPINEHGCNAVIESKYGSAFGIKNEILGVLFYLFVIISALIIFYTPFFVIKIVLVTATSVSLGFSAYLLYVQKYILRNYCFYCIISALISFLIFLNSLAVI